MTMVSMNSSDSPLCQLCGKADTRTFAVAKDYNWKIPGFFNYLICSVCGFVFQNPDCVVTDFSRLYPRFYVSHVNGSSKETGNKINTGANAVRAAALGTFSASGNLFDIGCGSGFFLEYMRQRGWDVSGLDPAKEHVTFANKELGLDTVANGFWPDPANIKGKMDAVSFLHAIEHFEKPVEALSATREILNPGGLLLIETPNSVSWPIRIFRSRALALDAPRHMVLFDSNTLSMALEKAGFKILRLFTYSPSTLEYTESVRYILQDLGLRRQVPKKNSAADCSNSSQVNSKKSEVMFFSAGKMTMHFFEKLLFRSLNAIADRLGYGCNLIAVARMIENDGTVQSQR